MFLLLPIPMCSYLPPSLYPFPSVLSPPPIPKCFCFCLSSPVISVNASLLSTHPQMFLLMFPVFTLSTNFPIIAITLRNNLKSLCLRENRRYSFFTSRCLFPLLTIIPPTLVGLATSDVEILVGITGAYAGSFIQVSM